jgi:hypothetical protein
MKNFSRLAVWFSLCISAIATSPALALDGIYLGAQVGDVTLSGNNANLYNSAIGYGLDLGFEESSLIDLVLHGQHSNHSGGTLGDLSVTDATISGYLHIIRTGDIDVSLGLGPGFYFFSTPTLSRTNFGLNFGANGDVCLDAFRVGIGVNYHAVFGSTVGANLWTIMMRVGYVFDVN